MDHLSSDHYTTVAGHREAKSNSAGVNSIKSGDEYVADTVYEIFDRKVDLRMGRIYTVIVQ